MITSGADIGGMGVHPRPDTSIVTGMKMHGPPAVPSRASRIAAIHALADWLALPENASIPVPTHITASVWIRPEDEVDRQTRNAAVESVANRLGEHISRGAIHQVSHYLADERTHGVTIVYRVSAFPDNT